MGLWLFENVPFTMLACGLTAQFAHYFILQNFPFVSLLSPSFLIGILMIVVNHYLAFVHFSDMFHSFSEVMAYFTLCQWLVPFALFVSLSANENVLPMIAEKRDALGKCMRVDVRRCRFHIFANCCRFRRRRNELFFETGEEIRIAVVLQLRERLHPSAA